MTMQATEQTREQVDAVWVLLTSDRPDRDQALRQLTLALRAVLSRVDELQAEVNRLAGERTRQ